MDIVKCSDINRNYCKLTLLTFHCLIAVILFSVLSMQKGLK